ncbi:hypothetical protein ACWCOP_12920 [Maricaulaceae bacterium MS644]
MTGLVSLLAFATLVGAAGAAQPCEPILSGHLLDRHAKPFVIVGERHGTRQAPRFFAELVCALSGAAPVIAGLEMEAESQPALDAFMASDGSQTALEALTSIHHWSLRDGRASQAMLDLLIRMRDLKAAGQDIDLLAFMAPGETTAERERNMAMALMEARNERPDARVAALIGRIHAERVSPGALAPMASYLPAGQTLTVSYVPWELCRQRSACGAFQAEPRYRIVANPPAEWRWPEYDFWYAVSEPFEQSPPAIPDAPEWGSVP